MALTPLLSHATARPRQARTSFESQPSRAAGGRRARPTGTSQRYDLTHFHPGQARTVYPKSQLGGSVRVLHGLRGHSACCRPPSSIDVDWAWLRCGRKTEALDCAVLHCPTWVSATRAQTRLSHQSAQSRRKAGHWCSRRSRPGSIWSVRAAAFARCDLAAITRHGIVSPRRSSPSRGVAPTATPNQRPRISPAVDTDVESGELIEAQLPLVLLMHDASQSSQAGSCSGEPPRGNQGLSWGQNVHHNSMGTCGAR